MEEIVIEDITYYGVKMPDGSVSAVLYFSIQVESEEDLTEEEIEKLPGKEYESDKDYSPKFKIADEEIIEWLTDNVKQTYRINMTHIYFDNQEDAMAFKLRWI